MLKEEQGKKPRPKLVLAALSEEEGDMGFGDVAMAKSKAMAPSKAMARTTASSAPATFDKAGDETNDSNDGKSQRRPRGTVSHMAARPSSTGKLRQIVQEDGEDVVPPGEGADYPSLVGYWKAVEARRAGAGAPGPGPRRTTLAGSGAKEEKENDSGTPPPDEGDGAEAAGDKGEGGDDADNGFVAGKNNDGDGKEDDPDNGVVGKKCGEDTVAKEGATPASINRMDAAGEIKDKGDDAVAAAQEGANPSPGGRTRPTKPGRRTRMTSKTANRTPRERTEPHRKPRRGRQRWKAGGASRGGRERRGGGERR